MVSEVAGWITRRCGEIGAAAPAGVVVVVVEEGARASSLCGWTMLALAHVRARTCSQDSRPPWHPPHLGLTNVQICISRPPRLTTAVCTYANANIEVSKIPRFRFVFGLWKLSTHCIN